jgi:hypothetical protein
VKSEWKRIIRGSVPGKIRDFFSCPQANVTTLFPKSIILKPHRNFMKNTNPLKWSGCFAAILAVALVASGQSAKQPAANTESTATTASAAPTPAAAPVVMAPAPVAAPAAVAPVAAAPAATAVAAPASSVAAVTPPVRIKCGVTDKMTDAEGKVWVADEGCADGDTYEATDAVVTNTPDGALFRTERYGMTAYNFTLPNGKYTVKLHFAEVYSGISGPGDRVFSFTVQSQVFKDFDIWVKAGGFSKAYVESADVEVTDGKLNITFTPKTENPKINAIEILPRA